MFKNRSAAGIGVILSNLIAPRSRAAAPATPKALAKRKPARKVSRFSRSVAGRLIGSRAPKLKRPRTPTDFEAIMRAEQKRQRKAAKLERDAFVHRCTYYVTRDAAVAEEAHRVYEALSRERAA